jgi:hypothetical protein
MLRAEAVSWDGGLVLVAALVSVVALTACQGGRSSDDGLGRIMAALPGEASGWRAQGEPAVYDADTIFSYINGHAEVYLAYAMQRCLSVRYQGPEGEADIVVDAFEMATPEDAFGVATHDREGDAVDVGNDGLKLYGWLSFWKGPYFVSIYAEDDNERSRRVVRDLGRILDEHIDAPGRRPEIVDRLPADGRVPRSMRFLRSHQILNSQIYLGEDNFLGLGADTDAALAGYQRAGGGGRLLLVGYPDADRCDAAARAFADRYPGADASGAVVRGEDELWYAMRIQGPRMAAVLAADDAALAATLLAEAGVEEEP